MGKLIISNGSSDLDSSVCEMMNSRLIFCYGNDDRSEPEIIRIYREVLGIAEAMPTFQAVLEAVRSFNWDIFYDGACVKYDHMYRGITHEDSGQEIHEMATNTEDEYNLHDNANLEYFVDFVLRNNRLACSIEPQDNIFHVEGMIAVRHIRDVQIILNDCQNVLFLDFIEHGIAGYGDYVNYYGIDNNEDTLSIGKGD